MAFPVFASSPDGGSQDLPRFIAAVALTLFLLYGSNVAIIARGDLFLGLDQPRSEAAERPAQMWAYVPIASPAGGEADVSADQGEAVSESHPTPPALAGNDLYHQVQIVRKRLRVSLSGRDDRGTLAVPLRAVMAWLGGEMQWSGSGPATVLRASDFVSFTPDTRHAERNYKPLTLPSPPYLWDGELLVPLTSLAAAYNLRLSHDPASSVAVLADGDRTLRVIADSAVFHIEIDRSDRWVKVFYAGVLAKQYRACTGEGENTPVGEFHIQNKCVWPGWKAYWGEYIPGGSLRNPLGARFLGTTARGRVTGWAIGIHGTNQPASIGRRISGGCVRLLNKHAIELYEVIPIGTRVTIHE